MKKSHIQTTVRWIVGLFFLAVALPKLAAPLELALAIFRYHLLPDALINLTALVLPWVELVAAVTLLLAPSSWRKAATVLLAGLLLVFTAAIAISLARGLDISCGCFTLKPGLGHIGAWSIIRNLTLLTMTIWAVWNRPRKGELEQKRAKRTK
ncbi:MAG: DoxX family protein [Verrucomicrobia bacterium]|nr:MAG: DoxX family protein [Verrucomicrobiota bacterium]